jgi:hypothetical protein
MGERDHEGVADMCGTDAIAKEAFDSLCRVLASRGLHGVGPTSYLDLVASHTAVELSF